MLILLLFSVMVQKGTNKVPLCPDSHLMLNVMAACMPAIKCHDLQVNFMGYSQKNCEVTVDLLN